MNGKVRIFFTLSEDDREDFLKSMEVLTNLLGTDRNFLQDFVEAIAKVYIKNTELIESINRFIKILESSTLKNVVLINPLDAITFKKGENNLTLNVMHTDNLLAEYTDTTLDTIKLRANNDGELSVHELFDWRND